MKCRLLLALGAAGCALVLSFLSAAEATSLRDVAYREGVPEPKLDFFFPSEKGFPTVVHVYGSGWRSGSGKSSIPVAEALQRHGVGCVLVSHRLAPGHPIADQAEDVAAAFAWAKAHVTESGGDPKRLFLCGHSTGGHLAALVAVDPKYLSPYHLGARDISGLIGLSAPVDLTLHADGQGYGNMMSGPRGRGVFPSTSEEILSLSPLHQAKQMPRRVLLLDGSEDFPMLAKDAQAFAAKARELGADVSSEVVPGKDHMGMIRALTVESDPVFLRVLAFVQGDANGVKH